MSHPFQDSLVNIEKRLEKLTKLIVQNQSKYTDDLFIDNDEFQKLMSISSGTATNWREQGIIPFHQIKSKIYYKMKDINIMLDEHKSPVKKK